MSVESRDIVQSEALWERVAAALRRSIVVGELGPGTHLKEPALAQRFGVSRLPIREAIARLEREALVRIEPRRGAFVVGITPQDISDLYECRLMLESHAVRRVAARIDATGVASLRALVARMETAVSLGQVQIMAGADMAFHRLVLTLSGNRALLSAWEPLAPLIATILMIANSTYSDLPRSVAGHRTITDALEQGNAATAEALLHEHLGNGEQVMLTAIGALPAEREISPTSGGLVA